MGRLNVAIPIQKQDIFWMEGLSKGHPVWLLTGDADSAVVIKGDANNDQQHVQQALLTMNAISPGSLAIQLAPMEIMALRSFAQEIAPSCGDDLETREALNNFLALSSRNVYKFTKMEYMKITTLGTGNTTLGNKQSVKLIAKAANAPGGLEDLGEIVAADMWNSNQDRFSFLKITAPGSITVNGYKMNFLTNLGNIMVRQLANDYRFVGLDALDPTSGDLDFETQNDIDKWGFRIFTPSNIRGGWVDTIAELCVADLKHALGKKTGLLKTWRLKSGGEARFAKGLLAGAKQIERHLKSIYGNNLRHAPKSVQVRAKLVQWI
ncbi:hypothetical protein F183_A45980 [Bryobacterales bacterium F-183]|nr:hypothetical protein F183_A45980 [Bryobacterales bacterium F-183]